MEDAEMPPMPNSPIMSKGRGRFTLGSRFGNVELELCCWPSAPASITVEWEVPGNNVPDVGRNQIIAYAEAPLRGYCEVHALGAFCVTIKLAEWPQTDPERATWLALYDAIAKNSLPPVRIYAPPDESDFSASE